MQHFNTSTLQRAALALFLFAASATVAYPQTTLLTGTFKTPEGKTPAQANLKSSATIGATPIYGKAYFRATDVAGGQVRELTYNNVTYVGEVLGFIKSDGTLISYAETAGVNLLRTDTALPSGLAYCLELQWNGSTDGRVPPRVITGKYMCKAVNVATTVDWATLPVASIVSPSYGYQTSIAGAIADYEKYTRYAAASVPNAASGVDNVFIDSADLNLKAKDSAGAVRNLGSAGAGDITDVGNCATGACFQTAAQNQVLAGPASGGAGIAAIRALVALDIPAIAESGVTNLVSDLAAKVPTTRTLIGGAGIAVIGDLSADRTISVDSTEAGFLSTTPQTCGAGTAGRAWVDVTTQRFCDNTATPTLQINEIQGAKNAASGYAGLTAGTKLNIAQGQEVWALADLSDVAAVTGTGTTAVLSASPTLTGVVGIDRQLEFTEAAGDPTCAAGNYWISASSTTGTLRKCQNGSLADLDTGGAGGDSISINGTAATDADFDDATPAAPANAVNVKWQKDASTPNNISAYVTAIPDSALATISTAGKVSDSALSSNVALYNNGSKTWGANADFTWTFDPAGATNPSFVFTDGILRANSFSLWFVPARLQSTGATTLTLEGAVADGATAIGVKLNNSIALTTAGAKLVSIQNAGVEKSYIDKDGGFSGNAATATTATTANAGDSATAFFSTGILESAIGGTGNGFTKFSGPATAEKTFTLPDATATILTSNAAVTVAQGGTGAATFTANGVLFGNGTSPIGATAVGTAGQCLTSNGVGVAPTYQACGAGGGANTALSNLAAVAINASLIPGAAGTLHLGSATLPFGELFFAGTSGTPGTNNFKLTGASTSGTRVITAADGASVTVVADAGAANNFLTGITTAGAVTKAQVGFSNLSGSIALTQTPLTTLGDVLYVDVTPALARLAGNITTTKKFLNQTGTGAVSAVPSWDAIAAGDVPALDTAKITTGVFAGARGGTNNGFMDFTGPTTSLKTFTLPDASSAILTSNAAVTIAQGGTGTASTLVGLVRGSATAMTAAELSGDATTSGSNVVTLVSTVLKDSSTHTVTNKTLDVEGTGNAITTVSKFWLEASACQNATATLMWDTPTTNPAVAACVTGTNTQKGVADFADAVSLSMQRTLALPSDWAGAVDVKFKWLTTAITGDVVWQIATICVADAETDDPAFNTASTVTDTAKGTTLQTNDASIIGITMTGCAAGEAWHIKVLRDAAHASDTLAATARLLGVELTIRRAQ